MKKVLSLIICGIMLLSVCSAATFTDMPNNWSTAALQNAVDNGLIGGSDGLIRPNDPMTRAEMATIMVRAFGATKEADMSSFTDVKESDWFYSSMAKAVEMGAFTGSDGMLNPQNNISRQETFAVLARMFSLNYDKKLNEILERSISSDEVLAQFSDGHTVAEWAKDLVAAVIASGYVAGSDGQIKPNDNITRAEFAAVMDRLVKTYVDESGTYSTFAEGGVIIRCEGVTLENANINGDLIIGEGAKDGAALKNTNVTDRCVVRSGSQNTIEGGVFGTIRLIRPGVVVSAANFKSDLYYYGKDTEFILGIVK